MEHVGEGHDDGADRTAILPARHWQDGIEQQLPLLLIVVVAIFSAIRPESYFSANNAQMIASTNAVLAILALAAVPPLAGGTIRPIDRLSARFGPVALRRNDHLSRRGAAAGGSRRHRDWHCHRFG